MRAARARVVAERQAAGEGWQVAWDALLGTAPDKVLAKRFGCCADLVWRRRKALGVASHRPHRPMTPAREWTAAEDRMLGTMPDSELAVKLGCTSMMVLYRRRKLGVAAFTRG
jgi:hypothetical protein